MTWVQLRSALSYRYYRTVGMWSGLCGNRPAIRAHDQAPVADGGQLLITRHMAACVRFWTLSFCKSLFMRTFTAASEMFSWIATLYLNRHLPGTEGSAPPAQTALHPRLSPAAGPRV